MKLLRIFLATLTALILLGGCLSVHLPKNNVVRNSEAESMSWNSLVKQALRQNPDLVTAREVVISSERSRDIAFGDYLPSVDGQMQRSVSNGGSGNNFNSGSSGSSSGGSGGGTRDRFSLDVVGTQSLFNGFGTTGNWIKARKNLQASQLAYIVASAGVRFRLRSVYVDLMRLERLVDVANRISARRQSNAELVRLRYDAGRENVGSALRAEAIAAQAAFAVRTAVRHLDSQSLRLARESGGAFILPVHIEDDMEKMIPEAAPSSPDYSALAEAAPNVQQLVKTAEAYKAAIVAAQSSVWPQLDGNANYGNSGDHASDLANERMLGLKMTVPFFNGGKNVEGIFKAKADYLAAEEAAVSQRDETVAKLAEAWAFYADAIEDVDVKRKFLVASRKRAEIIRVQYTTGLAGFQDFDIAEQENADSERNYVESLANALVQQANWEQIKGESLEESLNEI